MYRFGSASQRRLDTCAAELRLILTESILVSPVDFGISEGVRSFDAQLKYFLHGKSRLDPRDPAQAAKARHLPREEDGLSEAFDVFACVPGRPDLAYDHNHLCLIAGVILATAERLYETGKVSRKVRWGGNWDCDGVIVVDQSFDDLPHFELI